MKHLLESFLEKLNSDDEKLMEAVKDGFHTIFEGYADVREPERLDALTMFNQQAANMALNQGNPVLQFLQNSAATRQGMFTIDDEPELDNFDTSYYRPTAYDESDRVYIKNTPSGMRQHSPESDFGLTAKDLAINKTSDDDWQYHNWDSHSDRSSRSDDWGDLSD
jgi:hypothetical protein